MADPFDGFPELDTDFLGTLPFDDDFPIDDLLLLSPDSAFSFPDSSASDPPPPPPPPLQPLIEDPKPASPVSSSSSTRDPVKSEEDVVSVGKRKGGGGEVGVIAHRVAKVTRSENSGDVTGGSGEEEGKKQARLMRNRESAQLSRQRRKHYVEELEEKVRSMRTAMAEMNGKLAYVVAENATLRQQLVATAGGGMAMQPVFPPMLPGAGVVPIPWVPAGPYVVKPQGSQVPLLPIPRIKPQQPVPAVKLKKGVSGKTKKVASVSLLGLLFFVLLFGGLVPMVNVRYGSVTDLSKVDVYGNGVFGGKQKGRVLAVNGPANVDKCGGGERDGKEPNWLRNASEPLSASLYVPRNDQLVKIDGNLIIHSILASEKTVKNSKKMSSEGMVQDNSSEKTHLAIPRSLGSALAISASRADAQRHLRRYRKAVGKIRALGNGLGDKFDGEGRSTAADGPPQEWFREGLAGPIMSSGMCTEMFQFEVSSKPGLIVSTNSVVNASERHPDHPTNSKSKNRRILDEAIPLPGYAYNKTSDTSEKPTGENKFHRNGTVSSSVVVSILVDPRDAGDTDGEKIVPPKSKSLSRIFVVVLLDSVKYVTYSCVLPFKGSAPHLVAN